MRPWRISNHADLSGTGSLRAGGRWHSPGRPILYCCLNPAACLLEALVHIEVGRAEDLPLHYQLVAMDLSDDVLMPAPPVPAANWREDFAVMRRVGDSWLRSGSSLLLRVPSAVAPETHNVLLCPLHPDAPRARIGGVSPHPFDPRSFGSADA
jgi:RES domain-containing protein